MRPPVTGWSPGLTLTRLCASLVRLLGGGRRTLFSRLEPIQTPLHSLDSSIIGIGSIGIADRKALSFPFKVPFPSLEAQRRAGAFKKTRVFYAVEADLSDCPSQSRCIALLVADLSSAGFRDYTVWSRILATLPKSRLLGRSIPNVIHE